MKHLAWFLVVLGFLFIVSPLRSFASVPLSEEPGRVLYQIYLESFRDGRGSDGQGDFSGLTEKLDYLEDLGVGGILLMPIFDADDGMGYIPRDFYQLRADYAGEGSALAREEVLKRFLKEAHARDIQVYLDAPINHISLSSEWFQSSAQSVPGYENFFLWADHPLEGWKVPWAPNSKPSDVWIYNKTRNAFYYALFGWGMPEFNHQNPRVVETFDRFFSHYAGLGVDGFRIDAAKHLIEGETNTVPFVQENIPLLNHYLQTVRTRFPQTSFLIEVWSGYDEIEAFPNDSGDVKFDFPYMGTLRDSLKYNHPYGVRTTLQHMMKTQDSFKPGNRLVFAGNHDIPRLRTFALNDAPKTELGLALTLTLPYLPLIYYGDEIFMSGDYIRYADTPEKNQNDVCMPMLWTADKNAGFAPPEVSLPENSWNKKIQADWRKLNVETQLKTPGSFLNSIKKVIQARRSLPLSPRTRFFVDRSNDSDPVLKTAMLFEDGTCTIGLYNFSENRVNKRMIDFPGVCESSTLGTILKKRAYTREEESVDLDPYGYWLGLGKFKKKWF